MIFSPVSYGMYNESTVITENLSALHDACQEHNLRKVKELIAHGVSVHARDEHGHTPLHRATLFGHLIIIELLLNQGAGINDAQPDGWTPLHLAAWHGRFDIAKLLLARHANVNAQDTTGLTPLHHAALNNRDEIVTLLLHHDARTTITDRYGRTPLYAAVERGNVTIVKLLVSKDERLLNAHLLNDCFPLPLAAGKGHTQIGAYLLKKGVLANERDSQGYTALHDAARIGCLPIIQELIAYGADVNVHNGLGETPLHLAVQHHHAQAARSLLDHGARSNAVDNKGKTPLHKAMITHTSKIITLLLEAGASLTAQDQAGLTPLHYAPYYHGNTDVLNLLLCQSFFSPKSSSITSIAEQEVKQFQLCRLKNACFMALLKNIHSFKKKPVQEALMHYGAKLTSWEYVFVADLLPLDRQRLLVQSWSQKSNQNAIGLLVQTHCQRQLRCLQRVLALKDDAMKTARDRALDTGKYAFATICDHVEHAQKFSGLNEDLQRAILRNMNAMLGIK